MPYNYNKVTFILCLLFLVSCSYEFPTQPEPGNPIAEQKEKFEKFMVLGGSVTSGVMNGALYSTGQLSAYPNLLGARLDTLLGDNNYGIPFIDSPAGYNLRNTTPSNLKGRFVLEYRKFNSDYPTRKAVAGEQVTPLEGSVDSVRNFSIPQVRSFEFDNIDSLSNNKFYNRFAGKINNQTLLDVVVSRNPSVLLLSIGRDDLYPYILNGAAGSGDPPASSIDPDDATPVAVFDQSVQHIVGQVLDNTQADIILPTVMNPAKSFYFNTLFWGFTVSELNPRFSDITAFAADFSSRVQSYNYANPDKEQRPIIIFDEQGGPQYRRKTIVDENLTYAEDSNGDPIPRYRQMDKDEYLLYNAEKKLHNSLQTNREFATLKPAADKYVITKTEQDSINQLVESYNKVLRSTAQSHSRVKLLELSDLYARVNNQEVSYNGVLLNTGFEQNTIISADGYSLNQKGQALLANELVKLLNRTYNTSLDLFDVNKYPGNEVSF